MVFASISCVSPGSSLIALFPAATTCSKARRVWFLSELSSLRGRFARWPRTALSSSFAVLESSSSSRFALLNPLKRCLIEDFEQSILAPISTLVRPTFRRLESSSSSFAVHFQWSLGAFFRFATEGFDDGVEDLKLQVAKQAVLAPKLHV
jgi:hypothetical protein